MTLNPYLPFYWSNLSAVSALNANPTFDIYPASPGEPVGWFSKGGTAVRVPGLDGPCAVQLAGPTVGSGSAHAIYQRCLVDFPISPLPGWYVLEAHFTLVAGAIDDAFITMNCYEADGSTSTESLSVLFATDPDAGGVIQGAGTVGDTYAYRTVVQVQNPLSALGQLQFGLRTSGPVNSDTINFHRADVRLATPAEIAAANQVQAYPVLPIFPGQKVDGVEMTPVWNTKVKTSASGRRRATQYYSIPIWDYKIDLEVLRHRLNNDEVAGLFECFNTCQGQQGAFLYYDSNFNAVQAEFIATADGVETSYQLSRSINTWTEPIYAPFGVSLYGDGTLISPSLYTVGDLGVVTFMSAPTMGAALTWSGSYFMLCAFTADRLPIKQIQPGLWSGSIPFASFKPN